MADIDIEQRSPNTWLWWLLGALILGLLLIWLFTGMGRDRVAVTDDPAVTPVTEPMPTTMAPAAQPAQVQQFAQQCAPQQPGEMGLGHTYTAECIQLLAGAIEASVPAEQTSAVQPHLNSARQNAQQLAASPPDALNHSQMTREAFEHIAAAFQSLQPWHADMATPAQNLNQTAQQVNPNQPMLDQRDAVQRFFSEANQALSRLGTHAV